MEVAISYLSVWPDIQRAIRQVEPQSSANYPDSLRYQRAADRWHFQEQQTRDDAAGRIEDAFLAAIKAEPAEKKLKDAVRRGDISADGDEERIAEAVTKEILTNDEAELLRAFVEKRREVIAVDDFPADFGAESSVTDEPAPESGDTPDE